MPNTEIKKLQQGGVLLTSVQFIPTHTVVWTTGMRASLLTQLFSDTRDQLV